MKNCLRIALLLLSVTISNSICGKENIHFEISGVESSEIRENLLILLSEINPPLTEFDADEYQSTLEKQAQKGLHAYAYYNADIDIKTRVPSTKDKANKAQLMVYLDVTLNELTYVERVILQTDDSLEELPKRLADVIDNIRKMQGKAVDHGKYESLKSQLNTFALIYGYFDFKFLLNKLIILPKPDKRGSSATVHWLFNLGQRYRFGRLDFLDDTRGQDLATSVKTFKQREYFDQNKVGEFSLNMSATGYFDNAIARANSERAENYEVPIEVILKPKPKDLFKFGLGVSTDTGPRISIDWSRPWVNLKGHSLGGELYLSNPRKSVGLSYRIPKDNPLIDFINLQVAAKRVNENQTQSDILSAGIQRQWGARDEESWNKIAFLNLQRESFIQGLLDEQTTRLIMPGFSFNRIRKQGDIFVSWGDRQQITIEGASKDLLSDIDLYKIEASTKWLREFGVHRWVARADIGAISTNDFERVPSSHRFFAGGDQSIRGFGHNEVSDVREIETDEGVEFELTGGKYLSVASVEYAYRFAESWRVAAFFDAGSASSEFVQNTATGIGAGVHWLSPIGNVQVYIARGKSDFERAWRLHLIIGPGI